MDMGHLHLVLAYAATIGIHLVYVTYVAVKYRKSREKRLEKGV